MEMLCIKRFTGKVSKRLYIRYVSLVGNETVVMVVLKDSPRNSGESKCLKMLNIVTHSDQCA